MIQEMISFLGGKFLLFFEIKIEKKIEKMYFFQVEKHIFQQNFTLL
jgi:hypothetical protein